MAVLHRCIALTARMHDYHQLGDFPPQPCRAVIADSEGVRRTGSATEFVLRATKPDRDEIPIVRGEIESAGATVVVES
jgi:hypothetical protein